MSGVLITGGTGLLGPYLKDAARSIGRVAVSGQRSGDHACNLTNRLETKALLDRFQPDIVFHCAAMTNVDACEKSPRAAMVLNRDSTDNIASQMQQKAKLIYISTDQVYPDTPGPHREEHTGPVNEYGSTKLAGEIAALARVNSIVLRVNFFGPSRTPGRESISDWLITSLRARKPITIFTDSLFSPLHLETLAQTAVDAAMHDMAGVFNLGSRNGTSKCDFGRAIAAHLNLSTDTAKAGQSTAILGRAHRAKDLRMDVTRIEEALQRPMPSLQQEVERL